MTRKLFALLFAAALVAAGCGDDDDDAGGDASGSEIEEEADGGGEADEDSEASGDDQAAAEAAVSALEAELEDAGFSSAGQVADDTDDDLAFTSEECRDMQAAFPSDAEDLPGQTAEAESDDFEQGDLEADGAEEAVSATVTFVGEEGDLDEVVELFADDRLADCLGEALRAQFEGGSGVVAEELRVEEVEGSGLGDDEGGFVVRATLAGGGQTFPMEASFHFVRSGRAAVVVTHFLIGEGQATADVDALLGILVESVEDAA